MSFLINHGQDFFQICECRKITTDKETSSKALWTQDVLRIIKTTTIYFYLFILSEFLKSNSFNQSSRPSNEINFSPRWVPQWSLAHLVCISFSFCLHYLLFYSSRRDEGADEVTKSPRPSPAKNNPNFQTKYFPEPSSNKNSEPKGEIDFILETESSRSTTKHSGITSRTRQTTLSKHGRHTGFSNGPKLAKIRTRELFKINPQKGKRKFKIEGKHSLKQLDYLDKFTQNQPSTKNYVLILTLKTWFKFLVE